MERKRAGMGVRGLRLAGLVWAAWLAAGLVGSAAGAQPVVWNVDGLDEHHILFSKPGIYNFSRSEYESDQGVEYALEVEQDAKGRIQGTGLDTDGSADFRVEHVVKGRCKTKKGKTTVQYKMTSHGSIGSGKMDEYKGVGVLKGVVEGWGSNAKLVGTLKNKVCIKLENPKGRMVTECHQNTLEQEIDLSDLGDWAVDVVLYRSGAGVAGVGTLTTNLFDNDFSYAFEVHASGQTKAGGGISVRLTPLDPTKGNGWVVIEGTAVEDADGVFTLTTITGAKGEMLGQRFSEVY